MHRPSLLAGMRPWDRPCLPAHKQILLRPIVLPCCLGPFSYHAHICFSRECVTQWSLVQCSACQHLVESSDCMHLNASTNLMRPLIVNILTNIGAFSGQLWV